MSGAQPWESSSASGQQNSDSGSTVPPPVDYAKIAVYAQFALRLLGIMFLVDGIVLMVNGATYAGRIMWEYYRVGYPLELDAQSASVIAGGVAYLVIGLYFVVGGHWVIKKVFLPPQAVPNRNENE